VRISQQNLFLLKATGIIHAGIFLHGNCPKSVMKIPHGIQVELVIRERPSSTSSEDPLSRSSWPLRNLEGPISPERYASHCKRRSVTTAKDSTIDSENFDSKALIPTNQNWNAAPTRTHAHWITNQRKTHSHSLVRLTLELHALRNFNLNTLHHSYPILTFYICINIKTY